jgi:hypothetical protein
MIASIRIVALTSSACAVGHGSYAQALDARIGVRRIPHGRLMGEDHRLDPRLLLQGPEEGQNEVARQAKHMAHPGFLKSLKQIPT